MLTKKMHTDTSRRRGRIIVTRSAMGEQNEMDVDIMQNFGENALFDSTMRKVKKTCLKMHDCNVFGTSVCVLDDINLL